MHKVVATNVICGCNVIFEFLISRNKSLFQLSMLYHIYRTIHTNLKLTAAQAVSSPACMEFKRFCVHESPPALILSTRDPVHTLKFSDPYYLFIYRVRQKQLTVFEMK